MSDVQTKSRIRAALKKLSTQAYETPYAQLMFAVFSQAVADAHEFSAVPLESDFRSAKEYLRGDLPHLELCGIDPDYARRVMRLAGCKFTRRSPE